MRSIQGVLSGCLLAMMLVACEGDSEQPPRTPPTVVPWSQPAPAGPAIPTLSPVLLDLQRDYEALSAAYQALSAIWEGLAHGDSVRCGALPVVPDPAGINARGLAAYADLTAALRLAAIELMRSRDLWQAECLNPRPQPPPATISNGLLAVRAAGDALHEAETLLPTRPQGSAR